MTPRPTSCSRPNQAVGVLIGMLLDQQVPMERAFAAPSELRRRLGGSLEAAELASMETAALVAAFSEKPALHRFPASMAERVQAVARAPVEDYDGDTAAPCGRRRPRCEGAPPAPPPAPLPGFGEQKSRIFVALLAKRLGVTPRRGGRPSPATTPTPGAYLSVADID